MHTENITAVQGNVVELTLANCLDVTQTKTLSMIALPTITAPITVAPAKFPEEIIQKFNELEIRNQPHPTQEETFQIDVLLGAAHLPLILHEQKQYLQLGKNMACLNTCLGKVLMGSIALPPTKTASLLNSSLPIEGNDANWNDYLSCIMEVELAGKAQSSSTTTDEKDKHRWFRETTLFETQTGAFLVQYPFKYDNPQDYCSENFGMAIGRMRSTHNRLSYVERESYYKSWMNLLDPTSSWGPALEPSDQDPLPNSFTHYLSVLAVARPDSETTPIRPVADASARTSQGSSLNQVLFTGKVRSTIVPTLIQFRVHRHGLISDLKKAFYSLKIQPQFRDACRLPLPKDWKKPLDHDNYRIVRYQRLPMGLICSPWMLEEAIDWTLEEAIEATEDLKNKQLLRRLSHCFYVDNALTGYDTAEEGEHLTELAYATMRGRNFTLYQWASSLPQVLKGRPPGDCQNKDIINVLGLNWNTTNDTLCLPKPPSPLQTPEDLGTRRLLASRIASYYDPFGLLLPLLIQGRHIMAELPTTQATGGVLWDKPTDLESAKKWLLQEAEIRKVLPKLAIPRHALADFKKPLDLVLFCDASPKAYGYVAYGVQPELKHCQILLGRACIVTKKDAKTVPKLELNSIRLATRGATLLEEALQECNIRSTTIYNDSKIALAWIETEKSLPTYEANRVHDIRKLKHIKVGWIPTDENPADNLTRGLNAEQFLQSNYITGPAFLKKRPESWPEAKLIKDMNTPVPGLIAATIPAQNPKEIQLNLEGIKVTDYNDLQKLLRITAYVFRAITYLRKQPPEHEGSTIVTTKEIQLCLLWWIRQLQEKVFSEATESLNKDPTGATLRKQEKKMGLFLDSNSLLRMKTRLVNSPTLPDETVYPLLLPGKDDLTQLILLHIHEANEHCSAKQTLHMAQGQYWIQSGTRAVKRALLKCLKCQRVFGKGLAPPPPGPLPATRLSAGPPFSEFVGIDHAGPFQVLVAGPNSTTHLSKRWLLLFTCGTTRAVHVEMTTSTSARATLLGFNRFWARRGIHTGITYLDNGTGLVLASRELQENTALKDSLLQEAARRNLKFRFIPVSAPWMGGVYERLVGLLKKHLQPTLFKTTLDEETFATLTCRAEMMLNQRPLTAPPQDWKETTPAITPMTFLQPGQGHGLAVLPRADSSSRRGQGWAPATTSGDSTGTTTWTSYGASGTWSTSRSSSISTPSTSSPPGSPCEHRRLGETFLLRLKTSRDNWPLVRIIAIHPGPDNQIRAVRVVTAKGRVSERAVVDLVPLELDINCKENEGDAIPGPAAGELELPSERARSPSAASTASPPSSPTSSTDSWAP